MCFFFFFFFFQSCYLISHIQKVATPCKEQNKKKNHDNWLKNKKVIQNQKTAQKMPKNSKILV